MVMPTMLKSGSNRTDKGGGDFPYACRLSVGCFQ